MNSLSRNLEPWESDRELDPAMVRMMAEAFLPDLPQYEIQYVGSGWCNDVYKLNSDWILRFPRRRDVLSNLKKSAGVSDFLIPLLKETGVSIPEFSCVCPRTGMPDFAVIDIHYIPDKYIVELKSLKLYIVKYGGVGIFHEHVTNKIMDDFKKASSPRKVEVWGRFNPRGGISTVVAAHWPE